MAGKNKVDWDISKSESASAKDALPLLCAEFFASGRKQLTSAGNSPGAMHKFRLKTKRFRYTLELFKGCYGPGLAERLEKLHEIQDFLGKINDCAATLDLIGRGHEKIEKSLKKRIQKKADELREYWRKTFDAPGQERWWTNYMAHSTRR